MFRGVDPGGGGPYARRGGGHRRQDGAPLPRPAGRPPGQRKETAREIVDRGADYLPAVKENRGRLYQDVRDLFEAGEGTGPDGLPQDCAAALNKGHGRIERRECRAIDDAACLECLDAAGEWPGLRPAVKVESRRETDAGATAQAGYCISGLGAAAGRQPAAARGHWSIGNSLRRSMDVTFREARSRVRKARGPQNMAGLRRISRNLLKRETSLEAGLQGKRLQAGGREDYLLKVLLG